MSDPESETDAESPAGPLFSSGANCTGSVRYLCC